VEVDAMYEKVTDSSASCDLCGEKPSDGQLYLNEKQLCVCPECKQKLKEMPQSSRANLENYLLGNVV
jgi:Zn finger protein HypA/HybF involved in hydrogenase expression